MRRNHGFTLVELLIAITIASAVSVAIFGFMVVGARSFTSTSSDVNVQNEAQLVFNQIQDLLVDTNIGVGYDDDADKTVFTMYNYDPSDAGKHVYEVVYNKNEKKMYYNEYLPSVSGSGAGRNVSKGSMLYANQLMGENITGFSVDLSDMDKKRVVRLALAFMKNNSEYHSSHNVTLRNDIVIGSTIPAYIETVSSDDPEKVEGPENVYAEPGQVLSLPSLGNYHVVAEGGTDYPDQDIRFFMSDRAAFDSATNVSTDGTLTVSKAQKNDFYVTVATRTGKGAALLVKVNMIIIDSVDVVLTANNNGSADGLTFKSGETFSLKATVKGRNLDKASAAMYGIKWDLSGTTVDYVDMGAATQNADGSTCAFTMKSNFSTKNKDGKDPFEITATAVRSTQIPYYTGNVKTPVVGTFHGIASAPVGDFKIYAQGVLYRGKHMNNSYVALVDDMVSGIPGFDFTKHVLFAKVSVNELTYIQQEESPSQVYTIRRDVTDSGTVFTGEGTHLGITVPKVTEANPNSAFEYEVTYYIFDKHPFDYTNFYSLRVMGPGVTSMDGYDIANYKYRSNMVMQRCERIFIYYNSRFFKTNEDGSTNYSEWTGDMTASLRPRWNRQNQNQDRYEFWIPLYECDNVEDYGIRNHMGNRESFKIYYKKDGTWVYYDESRRIHGGSKKYSGLSNVLTARYENSSLRVEFYPNRWTEDLPEVIRVVPNLLYRENGGTEKEGVLFDNYVEIPLWNIEVKTVQDYQIGTPTGFLGRDKLTKLYFPSPLDPEFLELPKDTYKEWVYPYPANVDAHREDIKRIKLSYKLSFNADGNGNRTWYLHLRYYDNYRNEFIELGKYTCKDTDSMWTLISDEKVPDNLRFD